MGKYFSKFPALDYNGSIAKNLLARTKITKAAKDGRTTFYNYTLPDGKRADIVSSEYYGNPDYSWLIYLANNIIDPYQQYLVSDNDFNLYIIKKYGSLQAAYNEIHTWVQGWAEDNRELNPGQYATLPGSHKKYWSGQVTNAYSQPHKYVRSRSEATVATNRVAIVQDSNSRNYKPGDEYSGFDVNNVEYLAIVDRIVDDKVILKHVVGSIVGSEYTKLQNEVFSVANIPATEQGYWLPLSVYDYEVAINQARRTISLIDKSAAFQVEKDLKRVLNQ